MFVVFFFSSFVVDLSGRRWGFLMSWFVIFVKFIFIRRTVLLFLVLFLGCLQLFCHWDCSVEYSMG